MEPVLIALRLDLERQRRASIAFWPAWDAALAVALTWAPSRIERNLWEAALYATAGAWASAYTGTPAALGTLAVEELQAA